MTGCFLELLLLRFEFWFPDTSLYSTLSLPPGPWALERLMGKEGGFEIRIVGART